MKNKTLILASMLISGFFMGEPVYPQVEESDSKVVAQSRAQRVREHESKIQEIIQRRRAAARAAENARVNFAPKPLPKGPLKEVHHFSVHRDAADLIGAASFLFSEIEYVELPDDGKSVALKIDERNVRIFTELMAMLDVKEPPAPDASRFDHLSIEETKLPPAGKENLLDSPVSLVMNNGKIDQAVAIINVQVPVLITTQGRLDDPGGTMFFKDEPLRNVLTSLSSYSDATWWYTDSPEPTVTIAPPDWREWNYIPTINGNILALSYNREKISNLIKSNIKKAGGLFRDLTKPEIMFVHGPAPYDFEGASPEELPSRILVKNSRRVHQPSESDNKPVTIATKSGMIMSTVKILEIQLDGKTVNVMPMAQDFRVTVLAHAAPFHQVLDMICSNRNLAWWTDEDGNYFIGIKEEIPDSIPNNPYRQSLKSYQSVNYPLANFVELAREMSYLKLGKYIYDDPTGQLIILDTKERHLAIEELLFVVESYSEKQGSTNET